MPSSVATNLPNQQLMSMGWRNEIPLIPIGFCPKAFYKQTHTCEGLLSMLYIQGLSVNYPFGNISQNGTRKSHGVDCLQIVAHLSCNENFSKIHCPSICTAGQSWSSPDHPPRLHSWEDLGSNPLGSTAQKPLSAEHFTNLFKMLPGLLKGNSFLKSFFHLICSFIFLLVIIWCGESIVRVWQCLAKSRPVGWDEA